jgi:mycofactocin precursor
MENETHVVEATDESLVEEELLIEEISIDGMCGVY